MVLNRSVPGFLVNRFAQALFRESIYLIEQGVTTAADIDRAVKYACLLYTSQYESECLFHKGDHA